jgi:hypothetical protein
MSKRILVVEDRIIAESSAICWPLLIMRSRKSKAASRDRKAAARSDPDGYPTADHGYAATRSIKADPALRSIPIIAVTYSVSD